MNRLVQCGTSFFFSGKLSGFSLFTVATIHLAGTFIMSCTAIIGDGDTVYTTVTALYEATTEYQYDTEA